MILELTRCYKITGILKTMQLLFCYNFNQNAYDPFYEKKHDHTFMVDKWTGKFFNKGKLDE